MNIFRFTLSVLISNIQILMTVVVDPTKFNLKFWSLYGIFFIFTLVYFYVSEILVINRLNRERTNSLLEELFLKKIRAKLGENSIALIMVPEFHISPFKGRDKFFRTCLIPKYPLGLENLLFRNLIRTLKTGIEGAAFREEIIKIADFNEAKNKSSHTWGLNQLDIAVIGKYKCGIAVPLIDSYKEKSKKIGVLVIFSTQDLSNTPFINNDFQEFIVKAGQMISALIK